MSANDKLAATFGHGRTGIDLEDRISEAVTEHRAGATNAVQTCCMCDSTWRTHADHDAHAYEALSPLIREARANVLLDSANNLESNLGARMTMTAQTIIGSLRTRAMIERGNPDGSNYE